MTGNERPDIYADGLREERCENCLHCCATVLRTVHGVERTEYECENVYDGSVQDSCDNGFLCSVCGCKVEDEEHYRVSGVWNYCPQCGRKVRHG